VYEKDYILRIIDMAGVMLRAMIAAIREQRPDQVEETSREALTLILGVPSPLAESLTPGGLMALLSAGGDLDAKRTRLAAEVYVRRVQADRLMGLTESAETDTAKALRLLGAVIASGDADDVAEARALLTELEGHGSDQDPEVEAGPEPELGADPS
jgi:hypothetical protein